MAERHVRRASARSSPRSPLFTKRQVEGEITFSGFKSDDDVLSGQMAYRRMIHLEEVVYELLDRLNRMEERQGLLEGENSRLNEKCRNMESKLEDYNKKKDQDGIDEGKINEIKNTWKIEQQQEQITFREVLHKQLEDQTKETVVKVIKEKPDLVRDTVEKKKCVVVFGLKEKKNPVRHVREKEERELASNIVKLVQTEEKSLEGEIEEVHRVGKYEDGGQRPLKVRFRSQVSAEEVLSGAWRLAKCQEYKEVWVKRDMNNEEREKIRNLVKEAKEKNSLRSESEKEKYYWRVMDMRLRKWYTDKKEGEH